MTVDGRTLPRRTFAGFSLIESLITLLLFSIGLLGLGAMYARGLSVSHSSYLRSLASIQATDMAERIRANPWAASGAYSLTSDTCQGLASASASEALPAATVSCDAEACSASELAQWDLQQWCQANHTQFGSLFASAAITATDGEYLIDLGWKERVLQSGSEQTLEIQTFSYRMKP